MGQYLTQQEMVEHINTLSTRMNFKIEDVSVHERILAAMGQTPGGFLPLSAGAGIDDTTNESYWFVKLPRPREINEMNYAMAMHEVGHLTALQAEFAEPAKSVERRSLSQDNIDNWTKDDARQVLREERAAWQWAREHVLRWTSIMAYIKRITLGSYETEIYRRWPELRAEDEAAQLDKASATN